MIRQQGSHLSDTQNRHVATYVTNHGFGHINRLVSVLNWIDPSVRVSVRVDQNAHELIRERLKRDVEFGVFPSDQGTASPPGKNSLTDIPETFLNLKRKYHQIVEASVAEINWLKANRVDAIYADSSSIPMRLAAQANIPGFLGANFTWVEIYDDLLTNLPADLFSTNQIEEYKSIVSDLKAACQDATILRFWPHTPMHGIGKSIIDVGLLVNDGSDRRTEILEKFGLHTDTRLVYFYVGRYGVEDLPWERLNTFPDNVVLIGLQPPGRVIPGRYFQLDPRFFSGADLLKSADAAIVKAGYCAIAEAMAAGVPVVYPPRKGFMEFEYLEQALCQWPGGIPVNEHDFESLDIAPQIEKALKMKCRPPEIPRNGAQTVAQILMNRIVQ